MKSMLKKTIAVMLLASMALTAVACADEGAASDGTTTAANTTAATTTKATTTTSQNPGPDTNPTTDGGNDDLECPPYANDEVYKALGHTWVEAHGYWTVDEDGSMVTIGPNALAVAYGEEFTGGTITVEMTAAASSPNVNDDGIIFCLEAADDDNEAYFWETERSYYFVFINDYHALFIAKVGNNGNPFEVLVEKRDADVLANYTHGDTFTLSVTYNAGYITVSMNGEVVAEYDDTANPLTGTGWGIRGEVKDVEFSSVTIEPAE